MKIYNTRNDKYGWPVDQYEFLRDGLGSHSGWRWSVKLEMKIWNFIAIVVNFVKRLVTL